MTDPFRPEAAARLYRTGDLVRFQESGRLEFLGRADNQVKLRGFRIELGEIEATLLRHADVKEAVAVIGTDPSGEPGIHAFVAIGPAASTPASELRSWVGQFLPFYMIPSFCSVLPHLPRTMNGKIDRRALPGPEADHQHEAAGSPPSDRAVPVDDIERRLADIWRGLLGVRDFTSDSNFFELGGSSLLAAHLLARIETSFERRISLASLFQSATIGELAALLRQADQGAFEFDQVVRLRTGGAKPTVMAINNTGAFYVLSRRLAAEHSFAGLQLYGPSVDQPPPRTFKEIAAAYVRLIEQVEPSGPYVLIGWCIAGAVALETAHQLRARNHQVGLVVLIDTWVPGHLRRLSWLRAVLTEQTYRWHSIAGDCAKLLTGKRSMRDFLSRRNAWQRLRSRFGRSHQDPASAASAAMAEHLAGRRYHEEILDNLRAAGADHDPAPYDGRVILFTAKDEPHGFFLDKARGWGGFLTGRFDVVPITGDHSSMLQDPGAREIGNVLTAAIREQRE